MSMQDELIRRWDNFLAETDLQFKQSLILAQEAVFNSLEENEYNYHSSLRILTSARLQIDESVIKKIDVAWRKEIEPAMSGDGQYWIDEMYKGYRIIGQLYEALEIWTVTTRGKLSQKYFDHVLQVINLNFHCTQCHTLLTIQNNFFQSQYITCQHCYTVNTFIPEAKYEQVGLTVVDDIARLNSLEEMKAYTLIRKMPGQNSARETNSNHLTAYRKYLEKYFKERINLLPNTADTYEHDIELEMSKQFSKH